MEASGPERLTIEVDLAQLWVGGEGEETSTFAEYVASRAASRLLKGDLAVQATADYRRRVLKIADEEIRGALQPVIAAALDEAIQQDGRVWAAARRAADPPRDHRPEGRRRATEAARAAGRKLRQDGDPEPSRPRDG